MEERIGRLEANVGHIQSDVSEIKADVRRLESKVDTVKDSVSALRVETKDAIASLDLRMEKSFGALKTARMLDRIWWLTITGGLLSVMARGFKWI